MPTFGEVGVAARTVAVALDGFGIIVDDDACNLSDELEDVASGPHHVAFFDSDARSDLELQLAGVDLCVNIADLEPGAEVLIPCGVRNFVAEGALRTDVVVVCSLRGGVAICGETERLSSGGVNEKVLLLEAEAGHKDGCFSKNSLHEARVLLGSGTPSAVCV